VLFRQATLAGIETGGVTLAFRRWDRPRVRVGTQLTTTIGMVAIDTVDPVAAADITERDARLAGSDSVADLLGWLNSRDDGEIYRMTVRFAGPDPRIALRASALDDEEWARISARLERMDRTHGPWTARTLQLIADHPATRAAELAALVGRETQPFKLDVRKLKALGLTESLQIGYRLSPRGEQVLARLAE
jgi:hypothetical protein